jgi:glycine/D-amino acid oxidase-like deaminating enzyme
LEKETLASGCTSHGTGISRFNLRDADNSAHANLLQSHIFKLDKMIPFLEDESGMSVQYQLMPGMSVPLTDEAWESMQVQGPANGHKVLSGDAARQLEPHLGPEIPGVLWEPRRARVSGPKLTFAYARAAAKRGAEISLGEPATGVQLMDGRVVGVKTPSETIPCGAVVLAMGTWAPEAGAWFGVDIPVKPVKGEALRLVYRGPSSTHALNPMGLRPGFAEQGHVLFRMDGMVSVGSTMEDTGYVSEPTQAARDRLMRMAVYLWPGLAEAEVKHHVYGLRPIPADGLPILGPIPGVEGGFIVTGHGAVSKSALFAEITADYVLRGTTDAVPSMEPFLLERFDAKGDVGENAFGVIRQAREAAPTVAAGSGRDG